MNTADTSTDPRQQRATPMTLPLTELWPSPHNRRGFRKDAAFQELVDSVKALGVLQPVVARRAEPSGRYGPEAEPYELLAGRRRWEACRQAKLATIEARVIDCDDRTASAICAAENLQRADLTPLEEAATIDDLFSSGYDVATVAAEFGRTPQWVARRAGLAHLIEPYRKLLADPASGLARSPLGVAERLAALPAELQEAVSQTVRQWGPFERLADFDSMVLREHLRSLAVARWKLDDAELDPKAGSCAACPKRSAAQPMLFDDVQGGGKAGFCLDAHCWERKTIAHLRRQADKLKADHGDVVAVRASDGGRPPAGIGKALALPVLPDWKLKPAQAGQRGAVPALTISGANAGKVTWVKAPDPAAKGPREPAAKPSRNKAGVPAPKELRAAWICRYAAAQCKAHASALEAGRPIPLRMPDDLELLRLGLSYGLRSDNYVGPAGKKRLAALRKAAPADVRRAAFRDLLCSWDRDLYMLGVPQRENDNYWFIEARENLQLLQEIAGVLQLDVAELWRKATVAIRDPKPAPSDKSPGDASKKGSTRKKGSAARAKKS